MSKNRTDAGTVDIPIQRAIFGRRSVQIRLFWTTARIFWTAICGFVLWDRNQIVQGAIVRQNDSDRNSRTCLGARSARRDDSRRDLGRDRAKEAAKMNVERAHVQILKAVKTRQVGLGLLCAPARRSALHAGCCDGRAKPAPPPIVSCICQRSHTHADAYADGLETACRRAHLSVQSACGNSSVRSARRARRQTHAALGSCSRCWRRNVFTRASQRAESDFRLRRLLRYFFA